MMSRDSLTTRDRDAVERELDGERRGYWDRAARRLAVEINAGWWLSGWLPWAAGILAAGTFGLLYARWRGSGSGGGMAAAIGLALTGAAVVTWWRCRPRFETLATARVRLEDALGLDARLTAAGAGVGTWPAPPRADELRWPITWRWGRPVAVLAILGCLLAIAAWIPLEVPGESRPHVIEKPTDARVVEQWLEAVERAVDDKGVEEKRRAIAEILARPTERWYEHASLEAAGALKERTEAALRELAENLAAAERAAETLAEMATALPPDLRDRLLDELKAATEGLAQGDFRPPADLAEMLRQMEPSMSPGASGRCDPAEMRRLAEALAANRDALEQALAAAPGLDHEALERAFAEGAPATPAARPGRGGVQRGRADADLSLGEERDLGSTRKEKVDLTMDPARAAPQDLLAVVDGEHDVDEAAYTGPQAGGTVAHEGDGGMAAQVDALLPAERAAVRRFFE